MTHQSPSRIAEPPRSDPDAVAPVPDSVLESIERQAQEAGGPWEPAPEHEGCVGWTMFDTPGSNDGTVTVLLPKEQIRSLPRQTLVRINSLEDGRRYLGSVVSGPFAEPDGLRADAAPIVTATVRGRGGFLFPKYHGRAQVELIGEELQDGSVVPPRRRPLPNSPVFVLSMEETERILRTHGDIRIGLLDGNEEIEVRVPSHSKAVYPRHLGILGTTGGGKSTTVSGNIAQLQQAGVATIILDTEGEYTAICDAAEDPQMRKALDRRGLTAAGVANTHVYHLVGRETSNPDHPDVHQFKLNFCNLSPYAVSEILEFTPAQEQRYFQAFDVCKQLMRELGIFPSRRNRDEEQVAMEIDELETGWPRMTLSYMIDVASTFLHIVAKNPGDPDLYNRVFRQNMQQVKQRVGAIRSDSQSSWRALLAKLWRLHRLQIFDNPRIQPLNFAAMLQPGHVSIIDLSDTESTQVRNLVIAQLLRGIHQQQDENYRRAVESGAPPVPAIVFIEEAHEFLSAQRIKDMPVLFQQVARIARRGRKRWLGLVFISQLPQHLPDELFGLINNWVLHKISDANVVSRLRRSIGGIDAGLWSLLPNLAPGQAIVSFTSHARPLLVAIDPTPCRLLMVD